MLNNSTNISFLDNLIILAVHFMRRPFQIIAITIFHKIPHVHVQRKRPDSHHRPFIEWLFIIGNNNIRQLPSIRLNNYLIMKRLQHVFNPENGV